MLTVRTYEGKTVQMYLHGPPLRLRRPPQSSDAASIPGDAIRLILSFLPEKDWLNADSCCRGWRDSALPLWTTRRDSSSSIDSSSSSSAAISSRRKEVAISVAAKRRMEKQWRKLVGFLNRGVVLNGPATPHDQNRLQNLVKPFKLPPVFMASWKLYDGELTKSQGIYMGSRLLSVSEIDNILRHWIRYSPMQAITILRIPLFSETPARRQVAMELHMENDGNNKQDSSVRNGRILLISSVAPNAPHFKVLASSWDAFLTLV